METAETLLNVTALTSLHQQIEQQSVDEEEEVSEELRQDLRVHLEASEELQSLCADVQHSSDVLRHLQLTALGERITVQKAWEKRVQHLRNRRRYEDIIKLPH